MSAVYALGMTFLGMVVMIGASMLVGPGDSYAPSLVLFAVVLAEFAFCAVGWVRLPREPLLWSVLLASGMTLDVSSRYLQDTEHVGRLALRAFITIALWIAVAIIARAGRLIRTDPDRWLTSVSSRRWGQRMTIEAAREWARRRRIAGIRCGIVAVAGGVLISVSCLAFHELTDAPAVDAAAVDSAAADAGSVTRASRGAAPGAYTHAATFFESWRAAVSEEPPGGSYAAGRAKFRTRLMHRGPAPQAGGNPPDGVDVVRYLSHGMMLEAWISKPNDRPGNPALVYCHGGFALGPGDVEAVKAFRDAGFVVMLPTWRGENGNPGEFELFLGEADDAAAAVRWLADQDYVDGERVYAFGHSAGGGITSLLSLVEDLPLVHSGSSGGLYDPEVFMGWSAFAPFDSTDVTEVRWRLLLGNLRHMKRPHVAYVGTQDDGFRRALELADEEQSESQAPLTLKLIRGDHSSSLRPSVQAYLELIRSE